MKIMISLSATLELKKLLLEVIGLFTKGGGSSTQIEFIYND